MRKSADDDRKSRNFHSATLLIARPSEIETRSKPMLTGGGPGPGGKKDQFAINQSEFYRRRRRLRYLKGRESGGQRMMMAERATK